LASSRKPGKILGTCLNLELGVGESSVFKERPIYSRNLFSLTVGTLFLIITFALIGFVVLTVVIDNDTVNETGAAIENATPRAVVAVRPAAQGTPNPLDLTSYKSSAIGFSVEFPRAWRKKEQGLAVILSASTPGLNPEDLSYASVRIGIPADNTVDPTDLLTQIETDLISDGQEITAPGRANRTMTVIDNQSWLSTQVSFTDADHGGTATAWIATTSRDEVGYYAVAVAPAERWNSFEPTFRNIVSSFRFTSEAVLRPTDATPPPTPTPTPTPVIYVVESGDTLLQIALQYGVDVEALATRNGIDDPRSLRTGTKLIIPLRRRR
jgi:LysM repeat protein